MLEKLQYICNELKNKDEIIKRYGNDSKCLTFIISCKILIDIYYMIQCKLNFDNKK